MPFTEAELIEFQERAAELTLNLDERVDEIRETVQSLGELLETAEKVAADVAALAKAARKARAA